MDTQITITLPEETYRRAKYLAQLTDRDVADVLADTITLSLLPLGVESTVSELISELSDEEVLALANIQMDAAQDRRLSRLLDRQQKGTLTEAERSELLALMQVYQEGMVRKARALHEAVQRHLREPLEP